MTFNDTTSLAVAQLVVHILLFPFVVFVLVKHGRRGLLAYIYLLIFNTLRIIPAAIIISNYTNKRPESITSAIIDAIGLSPLLLCAVGVLDEVECYVKCGESVPIRLLQQILIHALTVGGVAISAVGASNLAKAETPADKFPKYHALQEAGSILLFITWIFLVVTGARLFKAVRSEAGPDTLKLYISVMVALLPIGARTIYGVVYAFDHSPSISPISGHFAIRVVLVFLMLALGSICIVVGGIWSRNIVTENTTFFTEAEPTPSSRGTDEEETQKPH